MALPHQAGARPYHQGSCVCAPWRIMDVQIHRAERPRHRGRWALLVFNLTRGLTHSPPWSFPPPPHWAFSSCLVLLEGSLRISTAVGTVPSPEWLPEVSHLLPWVLPSLTCPALYTMPRKGVLQHGLAWIPSKFGWPQPPSSHHLLRDIFSYLHSLLAATSQAHSRPEPVYPYLSCTAGQWYWVNHIFKRLLFSILPIASGSCHAGAPQESGECTEPPFHLYSCFPKIGCSTAKPPSSALSRGELRSSSFFW